MTRRNRTAILSLAAAGALWGLTVPLSKLALGWFAPAWLATIRFAVMAPVLAVIGRRGLREALHPRVAASGVVGFGLVVVLQNAGIQHTSVTHAAVVIGTVPVLVALIGVRFGATATRPITWAGYGLALGGVSLVAGAGGGGASSFGDLLVLASATLSAAFIVVQPRVLAGRDAAAVTAVQAGAGALIAAPLALVTEGAPHLPLQAHPLLTLLALCIVGTLLPFWLFAFGQARVPAHLAGAYLNLEPVVGAAVGWWAFGDTAAALQVGGAVAVLAGIVLSTLPTPAAVGPADPLGVIAATESSLGAARLRPRRRDAVAAGVRTGAGRAGLSVARRGCATGALAARRASVALADQLRSRRRRARQAPCRQAPWSAGTPALGRSWFGI